ncbi:MAG: hypothetical protein PHU14_07760 [Methylovulum sp.]|nr:hypothetical protein [Methylovulum sp.]
MTPHAQNPANSGQALPAPQKDRENLPITTHQAHPLPPTVIGQAITPTPKTGKIGRTGQKTNLIPFPTPSTPKTADTADFGDLILQLGDALNRAKWQNYSVLSAFEELGGKDNQQHTLAMACLFRETDTHLTIALWVLSRLNQSGHKPHHNQNKEGV